MAAREIGPEEAANILNKSPKEWTLAEAVYVQGRQIKELVLRVTELERRVRNITTKPEKES